MRFLGAFPAFLLAVSADAAWSARPYVDLVRRNQPVCQEAASDLRDGREIPYRYGIEQHTLHIDSFEEDMRVRTTDGKASFNWSMFGGSWTDRIAHWGVSLNRFTLSFWIGNCASCGLDSDVCASWTNSALGHLGQALSRPVDDGHLETNRKAMQCMVLQLNAARDFYAR
jgi:hypothetical protein